MTTYVDSNATGGANDGTSWTDAYLLLSSATGVAAGEEIWIASDHEEGAATDVTVEFSNGTHASPVRLISVNSTTDQYEAGALINATEDNVQVGGAVHAFGVEWYTGSYGVKFSSKAICVFVGCVIESANTGSGYGVIYQVSSTAYHQANVTLVGCTLKAPSTGGGPWITRLQGSSRLIMRGCDFIGGDEKTQLCDDYYSTTYTHQPELIVEDCDLSHITTLADMLGVHVTLRRCKLHASAAVDNDYSIYSELIIENCDNGSITVPPIGLSWYQGWHGDVKGVSSVYRTDGASDGETSYSWEMVSQSTCVEATYNAIRTPPITRWVDGGSEIDITVYVASGGTLNDDDLWIEVSGPDNTASPNQSALGYTYSSRPNILATPAALTTDSNSTWNGTGVGTKQKITCTYTPTEAGPVTVKVYLAKPSTTVYVDPKLEVS